ncbi:MAG: copper resistance protein B [bacterium]
MKSTYILPLLLCFAVSSTTYAGGGHNDEWFHRTDIELARAIDSNAWDGHFRYAGGPDFHKLLIESEPEFADGDVEELDIDLFYARPFGRYGLWKLGINQRIDPASQTRFGAGLEYELPYFIETHVTLYQGGNRTEIDIEIEREFALTQRWSLAVSLESRWASDTKSDQHIGKGWNYIEPSTQLSYRFTPNLSAFAEYSKTRILNSLKTLTIGEGEDHTTEVVRFGAKVMF